MRATQLCLVVLAMAALSVPAALAASGPTPVFPANATHVKFQGSQQFGLAVAMKLNETVKDGQNSPFWLTIRRTSGVPSPYIVARIGWNFGGGSHYNYVSLSDAQLNGPPRKNSTVLPNKRQPDTNVKYVDSDHTVMRIGQLQASKPYSVSGKLEIAKRSSYNAKHAMFFCVVLDVQVAVPGNSGPPIEVATEPVCKLYTAA